MIDFILHLDKHLPLFLQEHGAITYVVLFLVIFAETGFVIFPFLPGDSLLFALGVFSQPSQHAFNLWIVLPLLTLAAFVGDQLNYRIGKAFGPYLFHNSKSKIFRKENLEKTHEFYERHGKKTIILARFVPIVRAFAPFVAGMGRMEYHEFWRFDLLGAMLWVGICVLFGYLFGAIPAVKDHFELGALVIIFFTVVPPIVEILRHRAKAKKKRIASANDAM